MKLVKSMFAARCRALCTVFALVSLAVSSAHAKYDPSRAENVWTFDEESNTITDGNWVFAVVRGAVNRSDCYSRTADFVQNASGMQLALVGSGYRNGSGSVLDFTGTITGMSGAAYTLTFSYSSGLKGVPAIEELYLPKTLNSNAQIANDWASTATASLKTVVYDTPDYIGKYGFAPNFAWGTVMRNVTTFYINAPKLSEIGREQTSFCFGTLEDTDVSDWVLTSLTSLHTGNPKAFANKLFTGTIRLPAMVNLVEGSFEGCTRLEGAEIGTGKTGAAITIGASAFAGDGKLAEVVLGGGACSFAIGANAFACATLKKVTLKGGVPVCVDYADGAYAFGTDKTAADSIMFLVEDSAEWKAVLDDPARVTPWTEAERVAYAKAHPGEPVPFGRAAAEVFATATPQLVALPNSGSCALPQIVQTGETRYGSETLTLTCDCEPFEDGTYPIYATITVTVTPAATGHFAEWLDLPYASPDKTNPARFVQYPILHAPARIGPARFNHDWTATPVDDQKDLADGDLVTLSDGVWTLNATVISTADRKLRIGTTVSGKHLFADGNTGSGFLDLTGPVTLAGEKWTMTEYTSSVIGAAEKAAITDLYLPEEIENLNVQAWREMTALTNLVINCPNSGEYLASYGFNNNKGLVRLVLRVPRVKYLQNNAFDYSGHTGGCRYKNTDVNDWDLSGVEEIGATAFHLSDASAIGTLRLPAVRKIAASAFNGFAYKLQGLEFNSGKSASLEIAANAFPNASSLTNVTFGAKRYDTFSIDSGAFTSLPKLTSVTFKGKAAPVAEGLDNLLTSVAASDTTKQVTVYGCASLGWGGVGDRTFVTDEEAAAAPKTGYLGVWREGLRKAWIVDYDSEFKPKGLSIVVR